MCIVETGVALYERSLQLFKPQITDVVFKLRLDELPHTVKYSHGVFCFYQKDNLEYFGISFQGVKNNSWNWSVARKLHPEPLPEITGGNNAQIRQAKAIACLYPQQPGTFRAIAAPIQQLEIFKQLLAIAKYAEVVLNSSRQEGGESALERLTQQYDKFVNNYGLLSNFQSYWNSPWWIDLRLTTFLEGLEQVVKTTGSSKRTITKSKLLSGNSNYSNSKNKPKHLTPEFTTKDTNTNITDAFIWCLGYHGKIDTNAIAIACQLPVGVVEFKLLELGLAFRK